MLLYTVFTAAAASLDMSAVEIGPDVTEGHTHSDACRSIHTHARTASPGSHAWTLTKHTVFHSTPPLSLSTHTHTQCHQTGYIITCGSLSGEGLEDVAGWCVCA